MRKLPLLPYVLVLAVAFVLGLAGTLAAGQALARGGLLPRGVVRQAPAKAAPANTGEERPRPRVVTTEC